VHRAEHRAPCRLCWARTHILNSSEVPPFVAHSAMEYPPKVLRRNLPVLTLPAICKLVHMPKRVGQVPEVPLSPTAAAWIDKSHFLSNVVSAVADEGRV
jgi:hypothetical protein